MTEDNISHLFVPIVAKWLESGNDNDDDDDDDDESVPNRQYTYRMTGKQANRQKPESTVGRGNAVDWFRIPRRVNVLQTGFDNVRLLRNTGRRLLVCLSGWVSLPSLRLARSVLHSFIHSGHFYSAPSSPLPLRGTPDYSTDTVILVVSSVGVGHFPLDNPPGQ